MYLVTDNDLDELHVGATLHGIVIDGLRPRDKDLP